METASDSHLSNDALESTLPWILRISVAGCFIGHGAFGVITKAAWLPYFAVGGIDEPLAWKLMPWVGWMDISVGLLALLWPCRALYTWAAFWAIWTASLRPLAAEPVWELLERAGNYGVPLAIMAVVGFRGALFRRLPARWPELSTVQHDRLAWTLRLTTATLLIGHAGLGLFTRKAGLAEHYAAIGFSNAAAVVPVVGAFEFLLAALVLLVPRPGLLVGICAWKLATESLFIVAGAPFWEVIERFGSYAAPLALAVVVYRRRALLSSNAGVLSPVT